MMKQILVVLIVLIALLPAAALAETGGAPPPESPGNDSETDYQLLSSGLIPNVGQCDPDVEYILQHGGTTIFFTRGGLVLAHTSGDVIRQSFAGASPEVHLSAGGQRAGVVSYYVGNDSSKWLSGIPVYSEVVYEDLYTGIDLVYTEKDSRLKREFHISPGADPSQIELLYEGESAPRVDEDGVLRFASPAGEMLESPLVCWQVIDDEKIDRVAEYVVDGRSVRIAVAEYDAGHELIIDPELVYASYLGGSGKDGGSALADDGAGGVWVTGMTTSTDFPVKNAYQDASGVGDDIFISHFSSSGKLLSSTYLGGEGYEYTHALAGDGAGGVWVAGETRSTDFPVRNAYQSNHGGGAGDVFVAHFSSTGKLLSSTYLGGGGYETGYALAGDSSGGVWVTGETTSTNFPVLNEHQSNHGGGGGDAFIAHFSSSGNLLSSTYLGGGGYEDPWALAGDGAGGAWVTGVTQSTNFPVKNAHQSSYGGGGGDAFIAHFSSSGTLLSSTYLGGGGYDGTNVLMGSLTGDGSGGVWVAGETRSTDFPVKNAYQNNYGGGYNEDVFVAHFSSSGTLLSSTYLGGGDLDCVRGLAGDSNGGSWVAGYTWSSNFPIKNAHQSSHGGGIGDAFVAHFSSSGTLQSSTYLGGGGNEYGRALAGDVAGGVWVMGVTGSSDFPVKNAYQDSFGGDCDAFVSHFSSSGTLLLSTYLSGPNADSYPALASDGAGGVWVTGETPSTNFPVLNAYQDTSGGDWDAFIVKFGSIELIYPPTADFTANVTAGLAPLAVRFTDTSTGNPNEWFWDFGDGNTSTDRNPIHTYTTPGNYTVSFTVANDHGEDTVTREHYIQVQQPLPRAEFILNVNYNRYGLNDDIASGTSPCRLAYLVSVYNYPDNQESISGNLSFTLDAPEVINAEPEAYVEINGTRLTWTFPEEITIDPGTTLSTQAATSTLVTRTSDVTLERSCNRTVFTEAGVQQVTLNMTFDVIDLDNFWGRIECFDTDDVQATFVPDTISTDLPLLKSSEKSTRIQFTADRSHLEAGRQYTLSCMVAVEPLRPVAFAPACAVWEVRNSTSVTAPAGTQVALPAELLTQSVNDAGFSSKTACEWTCTRNNHVITSLHQRATPVSTLATNFTANVTIGPAPLAVRFADTSTGNPTAWNWDFGDNTTSTEQYPIHTYTAPGNYTVNLTVSSGAGSDVISRPGYITVTRVRGDLNGDGDIDISDVSRVAYMVVGKVPADPAADFNGNGKVDIGDAAKIACYLVGKTPAL